MMIDPNTRYLLRRRMEVVPRAIRKHVPPGRTLEAGAGSGWMSLAVASMGHDVVALDNHESYFPFIRRQARRMKSNIELIEGDAMSLPFADCEFDVAMSVAVLEHLPDPRQGAAELRRVVRPGGHLVIGMPNWHSQYMILKKMEMWLGGEIDYNTRIHTAHSYISIREMFRPYGFKELCALPIAPFSIPPSLLKLLPGSRSIERLILMAERGLAGRLAWLGQHVLFIFQRRVD